MFSTRAESELHRSWGCSVVGMTAVTEARLAREAELAYAAITLVTDYDCWKEGEEVSNDAVVKYIRANTQNAKRLLAAVVLALDLTADMPAHHALEGAIMNKETVTKEARERLQVILGRHLKPSHT
eukprot:TRINITY_DN1659_c0_g1_i3.p2 TRINITY_DN1659_c0_g1~~TRINITY_DN1659_c0_g1_i3.p2  ORF type:complete len:126 (+),score=40.51 TRINITY_DN1659_c0_g1_i3:139-516(+)